ncbi:MAG: hypothetical protein ABSF14_24870 [Terriglobia bacterium]|jgi:hypothetical protein
MNKDVTRKFEKSGKSEVRIDDDKISKVAERVSKTFEIPIDEASAVIKIGSANAIMLNRFRKVFDKDKKEE